MMKLARWHIWLGWLAALPILIWTISGLFMTLRPIEEVRGENLRRPAPPVSAQGLVFPRQTGPIIRVALVDQRGNPVWLVSGADKTQRRYSASDGALLGPVLAPEARELVQAVYAGPAALKAITRFPADANPLELRRERPAWQARFADGTHIYIDADSGEVLALRTGWWRAFDFMWGLHILDPIEREDTSHPLLWITSIFAVIASLLGTILLFRRRKARR
jgi:hypothetical protein